MSDRSAREVFRFDDCNTVVDVIDVGSRSRMACTVVVQLYSNLDANCAFILYKCSSIF